jgi:phosphatidylglycerol---prolipoprotein diacylglyceryl transferase
MDPISCSPIPGMDPVIFSIGPIALRWYALAYIVGLLLGWRLAAWIIRRDAYWQTPAGKGASPMSGEHLDDLFFWATLGVILGGRLGYVLFYMHQTNPGWFAENPLQALYVWQGGMSFHGGLIGVAVAIWWVARKSGLSLLSVGDVAALAAPVGLFFGRVANFINGELYGRATDGWIGMVFPCDRIQPPIPRHPSQIYEAVLEGLVLLVILWVLALRFRILARPGLAAGIFLIGYGVARTFVEHFREPDQGLEGLPFGLTMGMILSVPMWLGGAWLIWKALKAGGQTGGIAPRAPSS